MIGAGKARPSRHVEACLGEDLLGTMPANAGYVVNQRQRGLERAEPRFDLLVDGLDLGFQLLNHAKLALENELLVSSCRTGGCVLQLVALVAELRERVFRHRRRVSFTGCQLLGHGSA